jgi:hypothetical protein
MFVWLVTDGWCWFVLREKYCWLVAGLFWENSTAAWCLISQANRVSYFILPGLAASSYQLWPQPDCGIGAAQSIYWSDILYVVPFICICWPCMQPTGLEWDLLPRPHKSLLHCTCGILKRKFYYFIMTTSIMAGQQRMGTKDLRGGYRWESAHNSKSLM